MIHIPLAHRIRPQRLDDYVGQVHLLGPGAAIQKLAEGRTPTNVLFWGPPGVGKTTLAQLLSDVWQTEWHALNATLGSVSDIKKVIDAARVAQSQGRQTVLFVDELHRFSKTQQDTLLSVVEDGTLVLMGATTENPRFSVIPGLVSRSLIFECRPLTEADLDRIKTVALATAMPGVDLDPSAHQTLSAYAAGDARKLCNAIELVSRCFPDARSVSDAQVRSVLPEGIRSLDDTTHYDLASALIKALRGSDADAALYWLARLLESGEDPIFIARRCVVLASEDIGNADPTALTLAISGMQAAEKIGMPEVRITLAHVVAYLACAPKSNASYTAIEKALAKVRSGDCQPVPAYLRTRPSQAMSGEKKAGRYHYPHDYPHAMVAQRYWDESECFYDPKAIGFEREIQKRMAWIRKQKNP